MFYLGSLRERLETALGAFRSHNEVDDEVKLRLDIAKPCVRAGVLGMQAPTVCRRRRNAALHAFETPATIIASATGSHLNDIQRGVRRRTRRQGGADDGAGVTASDFDTDASSDCSFYSAQEVEHISPSAAAERSEPSYFDLDIDDLLEAEVDYFGTDLHGEHEQDTTSHTEANIDVELQCEQSTEAADLLADAPSHTHSGGNLNDDMEDRELRRPGWLTDPAVNCPSESPGPLAADSLPFDLARHQWPPLETICRWCGRPATGKAWCASCHSWWMTEYASWRTSHPDDSADSSVGEDSSDEEMDMNRALGAVLHLAAEATC